MHTNRAETRSIAIAAAPEAVFDFVADARALPRWAPDFARSIRPEGAHWIVDDGRQEFAIDVRVAREARTVDFVSPADTSRGAFTRVVANGAGSEYLFTSVFGPGADEAAVAVQMAVVESELRTVRDVCEAT
jgi:uncharacterized protein YndB with AHSA1/START domain